MKEKHVKPTESELDILRVLWENGDCTVRKVHETLMVNKDCGYTTTLKLMQIMFEKGLVTRDDSSKTHVYAAAVSKLDTQGQFVNRMIDGLFSGSSANLVLHALGNSNASEEDLQKIEQFIKSLRKNG
jgi:BlaI family transcriptional regulator, penicillinase repressor